MPLLAAAVGAGAALIVGILTQLWTGHRENVRWTRERNEREAQWNRERQERQNQWKREDSLRWLQIRQEAYARLIGDLRDWDDKLRPAVTQRQLDAQFGTRTEIDKTEAEQVRRVARENLTLVQFMAPEKIAGRARSAVTIRDAIQVVFLDPTPGTGKVDVVELDKQWQNALRSRTSLQKLMRDDLGIENLVQQIEPKPGDDTAVKPEGSSQ
jgi:hypothetical protein